MKNIFLKGSQRITLTKGKLKLLYLIPRFKNKLSLLKKSFSDRLQIFSLDTETVEGEAYTIQMWDSQTAFFKFTNPKKILYDFYDYIRPRLNLHSKNLIFVHNITYDISVLLSEYYDKFIDDYFEIKFKDFLFSVNMANSDRWIVGFTFRNQKIQFIDSFYFFNTSLENIAETLQLEHRKIKAPKTLGLRKLKSKKFIDYAMNDVKVEQEIAEYLLKRHKEFDIPMCFSIAQFAQRIFQKHFLKKTIALPSEEVLIYSLKSYHGGKNAYYEKAPKLFNDVYELDIVSAYPYAMSLLPSFYSGEYFYTTKFIKGMLGVYHIKGNVKDIKYKVIPTETFSYKEGVIDTYITSFELEKALEDNLIELYFLDGFVYENFDNELSPFKEFVNHFFKLKTNTPKTSPLYIFYKTILNSLYGKFIQKNVELDITNQVTLEDLKIIQTGGLFHPFIASMITGQVRAKLYELEKKYCAIHSSTDSIKTQIHPQEISGLGGQKIECFGDCIIFRPKLYIHYNREKKFEKIGLHGFQGSAKELERIWISKDPIYYKKRIIPIRESLKRHLDRPLRTELKKLKIILDKK